MRADKFYHNSEKLLAGAEIEDNSGYTNLFTIRRDYYHRFLEELKEQIHTHPIIKQGEIQKEKLFDWLYSFLENGITA